MAKLLFFSNLILGVINMILGNHGVAFVNFVAVGLTFNDAFQVKS